MSFQASGTFTVKRNPEVALAGRPMAALSPFSRCAVRAVCSGFSVGHCASLRLIRFAG